MLSDNKVKCLKLGVFGLFDNQRKKTAKNYRLIVYAMWFWIIVSFILKAKHPEYKNALNLMSIALLLNNGVLSVYFLLFEIKDRLKSLNDLAKFFEAIDYLDEDILLSELEKHKVSSDKIDDLIDRIKKGE